MVRLDRKSQGHALLEALGARRTGHGRPVRPPCTAWGASRCEPRAPTMPAVRAMATARSMPRQRVVDVAEVVQGEGSEVEGIQLGFDAPRPPWRRRWLVAAASRLSAKWACRFRYSDWALRARASSSVGESPAYSMASRIASCFPIASPRGEQPGPTRSRHGWPATGRARARACSTAVRTSVCQRSSSSCSPADSPSRTTISACGWPATASASGTRSHSDSARSNWVMASAAPSRFATSPARTDAARVRGRSWAASQWKASRLRVATPGSGLAVDPGLEDLGQPGVDPSPFVGHQVVVGRLTQQRVPELQVSRLLWRSTLASRASRR